MNRISRHAGIAALALALVATGARAQSAADHAAHHPGATVPTSPSATGGSASMPGSPSGMGGPSGGGAGMMGGGMPAMAQMMQMMRMMGGMMAQAGAGPAAGMMRFDHIAGRIAFLKAELAITPAQNRAWTAFADALKGAAAKVGPMRAQMPLVIAAGPLPERLHQQTAVLEARVAALRGLAGPTDALYRVLTPAQRRTADALMTGPRGMM
ncbi:MAG TPA: Spy/CpxP family protein refolding chaperone [Acetobacteraceae bacterium]|nr:Spy/CpxP family protein refolding chaperone [Acetobacteraceae bacterium]